MSAMRVLWFCSSASGKAEHNGSGWIASMLRMISGDGQITLGVCSEGDGAWNDECDGIRYYPIDVFSHRANRLKRKISTCAEETLFLPYMLRAIEDFKPDVIHIWGTESMYGTVCRHTSVPCIIHLQGLLAPYENALYPPGFTGRQFLMHVMLHPVLFLSQLFIMRVFRDRAEREVRIIKECQNFLGRTEWDRAVVKLYHPEARYFYDSEMLRQPFMTCAGTWKPLSGGTKVISSVISMPTYKGHDLILKTAKLLSGYYSGKFVWNVYGVYTMDFWEKHLKISAADVHVQLKGTVSAEALKDALLQTDIFVHPSYIDNSPNSLCEAQLLGLPVIAAYVGGVPSLIENGRDGLLVPANDPWMMAEKIISLLEAPEKASELGHGAAQTAKVRHDPEKIIHDLLSAYQTISGGNA